MTTSRVLQGTIIILFVVVVQILMAYFISEASDGDAPVAFSFADCDEEGTHTDCENVGKTSFFQALAAVSFTGLDVAGAPLIVNVLYVSILGLLLSAGVLLVVLGFVPTTSA